MKLESFFTILFVLLGSYSLKAQSIIGLSTNWSDSFSEWTIYTDDEEITGDLKLQWLADNDWTDWRFSIGDDVGRVKMKWNDDPNQWELRAQGQVITIRTVWRNDPSRWRITDNRHSFTMTSKWRNLPYEWKLQESKWGEFEVYMTQEPDPRDWDIYDNLSDEISMPIKMAMIFITVYHSTPKW